MKKLYLLLLLCCASILSHGQVTASSYGFTPLSGTFSSISSTGTSVPDILADDATTFTPIPIGFTFSYCGTSYTSLTASSNGWLSFLPSSSSIGALENRTPNATNLGLLTPGALFPFWVDLDGSSGSSAYYLVEGTAPNRVFTFEWSNFFYYPSSFYTYGFDFQVKLYESTNVIEFVYNNSHSVVYSGWSFEGSLGIGNSSSDYRTLGDATASPTTSSSTFISDVVTIPASGQIYRFTPPPPCTTTPDAGTAVSSVGNACPSTPFTLSLTGATAATGFTYQWQSSADSITWADMSGATTGSYDATETDTMYYRCIVVCPAGGIADTSVAVKVPFRSICPCVPSYMYASPTYYAMNNFTITGYAGSSIDDTPTPLSSSGYNDRSAISVDLMQGNTYSGSISYNNPTYGGYTNQVWIDFNDDGVFDASESMTGMISEMGYTYGPTSFSLSIPMTAPLGTHLMRVRNVTDYGGYTTLDPCTSYDPMGWWSYYYGSTFDYTVNIIPVPPCSGTPTVGVVGGSTNVCPSATFGLSLTGYTIAGSLNFQWQSSTDSLSWTNISGATSTSYSGTETATTYYRCYVTCTTSGLADTSAGWRVLYRPICPCIPTYASWSSPVSNAMDRFTVTGYGGSSIDDSPAPLASTGYMDRTSISVDLMQGNSYSGTISYNNPSFSGFTNQIWIDFNDDGVFDASESVTGMLSEMDYTYGPSAFTLAIPITAPVGSHLMRVRNVTDYGGYTTLDPCTSYDPMGSWSYYYGSTFDYTVNIIPLPPCSGTPSAGTISGNTNVCPSATFTLASTGYTIAGSLSFQWQISNDSATWVNIAGATSTTYSGTESSSNYYRLVVNCTVSGESDTTAGWEVIYRPICPCIPSYSSWSSPATSAMDHFTVTGYGGSSIDDSPAPLASSGYMDRTSISVDLMQGNSYSASIDYNNYSWSGYHNQIWIDFNDNGIFESSESVSGPIWGGSSSPTSLSINIPLFATLGAHTMRVRTVMTYSSTLSSLEIDPCYDMSGSDYYYYGSTFDYMVNIVPLPPCTGTPEAGTVSGTANVCPSATFTLAASGYSVAGSLSFQWQSSTDSLTWTNITGAVGLSYSGTETATTYYRCMVTCIPSGISDSTNGWKVVYRSICPCVPSYMAPFWGTITDYAMNHFDVSGYSGTSIDDSPSPLTSTGYMDRTPMSVSFMQGHSYSGNIGYNSWSSFYNQVWIDYNDDGIFTASERVTTLVHSFDVSSIPVTINVSLYAPVGTHVMRVRNVQYSYSEDVDPCLDYSASDYYYNGSTFDYYVNIVAAPPCSGTPTAGNIVGSTSACPSSDVALALAGGTIASSLTFQWYSSSDSITWTAITGATLNTLNTTTSAATYYTCVVGCSLSGQRDTTNAHYVTYTPGCYCVPNYTYASSSCSYGYAISSFGYIGEMGTALNDVTSCNGSGYQDLTSMSATVFQGGTYSATVTHDDSWNTMRCKVWIDFDDNGTFDPVTELVGGLSSYYSPGTFDISIPSGALVGSHRMRIVTYYVSLWGYSIPYSDISPCPTSVDGYNYGEARDYTVNIMPPSCYGMPTAGTVSATVTEACVGYSSNLTVSGYTDLAGISFQWQSSTDSATWTDISGATATGITVTPTTSTYYRVRVHCMYGAADDYTAGVRLIVNPYPAAITGSLAICNGTTTTLSTTSTGGTWTSSNPSVANIDAAGNVSALSVGTSTISYTFATGCGAAQVFTVNPNPLPISGPAYTCLNVPFTTFSTESSIGTWSISSEAIATISATGNVYPVSLGTATITYSYSTGCFATTTTTVSPYPAEITGLNVMCGTTATALMSTTSSGGAWSSSAPGIVSINTLGLASAVSEGSAVISYTYPVTGCNTTHTIDVTATPAPITGPSDACIGAGTALSCASLYGTWSSASTAVAVVNPTTGVVTGVSEGTTLITYTLPGGCISSRSIHVNPLPAPIVGSDNLCVGLSGLYTDATSGGVWTVTPASVAGVSSFGILSGVGAGTATLSYTNPVTGCRVTKNVAVNNIVAAGINVTSTAPSVLCAGTSVTYNAAAINGGTAPIFVWSVNGTILSSGASYTYTPADGDVVKCKVTSNQVCAIPDTASQSMTMNVHPVGAASVSISTGMGDTVCTGALVAFTPTIAMGGTTPTYQWTVNYVPVSTSAIFAYLPSNGDIVQLTIVSSDVCATSTTASTTHVITVSPYLTPAVTLESSATGAICMGTPAVLTATPINGGFNPEYIWLVNGSVTGETSNTYGYIPANGDVVQVNMSSSFPCVVTPDATNTMVMTVVEGGGAVGYISASPSTSVTPGTNVHFTANMVSGTSSTTTYQWYVNGVPVPGATATTFNSTTLHTGDSVTCVVTNAAPCAGITVLNALGMVVEWPSNINNVEFNPQVLMLPNPTRGAFTVKGQIAATADENVTLEVTDMLGVVIYREAVVAKKGILDHAVTLNGTTANGMYILNVKSKNYSKVINFVLEQ